MKNQKGLKIYIHKGFKIRYMGKDRNGNYWSVKNDAVGGSEEYFIEMVNGTLKDAKAKVDWAIERGFTSSFSN